METNVTNLDAVLRTYRDRISRLTVRGTPWTLFHALMGNTRDFDIVDETGTRRGCLDWLCRQASWQPSYEGMPVVEFKGSDLFFVGRDQASDKRILEGHFCQFLWILSECGVDPSTFSMRIPPQGENVPLARFVASAESFCDAVTDLSWAIPVIGRWGTRETWTNRFGEEYCLERLIEQHLDREKRCVPCFSQHWRMGLAVAFRDAGGRVPAGLRARMRSRLAAAVDQMRSSQDDSGRFRLEWGIFPPHPEGVETPPPLPSAPSDVLSHQGHVLAWLMVGLSDEQLATEEWPHRAAACAIRALAGGENVVLDAHAHCIHALRLYEKRMRKMRLVRSASEGVLERLKTVRAEIDLLFGKAMSCLAGS